MKNKSILILFSIYMCLPALLSADDVLDAINEGTDFYKNSNYIEAANSLEYAAQLAREKVSQQLGGFFPKAPNGWEMGEPEFQSAGASLFGGGNTAEVSYSKGEESVTITIAANSPALQSFMMLANNSAFLTASGKKMDRFAGQKAIVEFDEENMSGNINVIVAGTALVTIDGSGTKLETLKSFAGSVAYKELIAMLMQ